jgi:hypothetical protein
VDDAVGSQGHLRGPRDHLKEKARRAGQL